MTFRNYWILAVAIHLVETSGIRRYSFPGAAQTTANISTCLSPCGHPLMGFLLLQS